MESGPDKVKNDSDSGEIQKILLAGWAMRGPCSRKSLPAEDSRDLAVLRTRVLRCCTTLRQTPTLRGSHF